MVFWGSNSINSVYGPSGYCFEPQAEVPGPGFRTWLPLGESGKTE